MRAAWILLVAGCGRLGFDARDGADAAGPGVPIVEVGATSDPVATIDVGGAVATVALPAGTVAGDLALLAIYTDRVSAVVTAPPGWDARFDMVDPDAMFRASYFDRRVAAGDPATYDFTITGGDRVATGLVAYRGVSPTVPYDDEFASLLVGAVATVVAYKVPSLATTSDGDALVLLFVNDGGTATTGTWTAPSGTVTVVNNTRVGVFATAQDTAGDTGAFVATIDPTPSAGSHGAVRFVALRR